MKNKRYGWIRDLPDLRDRKYSAVIPLSALPPFVDLRQSCPPVWDQGSIGSCSSHAIGAAFMYVSMKEQLSTIFTPSRLFHYYNERVLEHSTKSDSGAQLRDGIKAIVKWGMCDETLWPYDVTKFAKKPTAPVYRAAYKNRAIQYQSIPRSLIQMKSVLASGFPFILGISVYESFESDAVAKTGIVPMPDLKEEMLGGHAVLAVGFSDIDQRFIIRNSWSESWGQSGYFTIPYDYIMNHDLADDFWEITYVPK